LSQSYKITTAKMYPYHY